MPEFNYDTIAPLVAKTDVSGYSVTTTFRCPVSNKEITGSARIVEDQRSEVGNTVKRSLWSSLRYSLMQVVRSLFGYGVVGQVGSAVADGAMSGSNRQQQPSERLVKQAVVDAFRSVQEQFAWDGSTKRFVAVDVFRDLQTEFAIALQAAPITKQWDRAILARMLVEIAAADGNVDATEREFFQAFIGDSPSLDELLTKPKLNAIEVSEVTADDTRRSMLLLALAVAMTDQNGFLPQERERVAQFAGWLNIPLDALADAEKLAADYLVDQAFERAYADGTIDDTERRNVDAIAARLQVDTERLQRLDVRCRKRKGLV